MVGMFALRKNKEPLKNIHNKNIIMVEITH